MNKYNWKLKSFAKGIDADSAIQELEKIESLYGSLTPENIVKHSESTDAVLHTLFEWDNSIAAERYRQSQARTILNNIEVTVVSDSGEKNISVYEVVSGDEGRVYKHISALTTNEIEEIRKTTLSDLNRLKSKLANYNQFNKVVRLIETAVEEMQKDAA